MNSQLMMMTTSNLIFVNILKVFLLLSKMKLFKINVYHQNIVGLDVAAVILDVRIYSGTH